MSETRPEFDCLTCGACCHLYDVPLSPTEADKYERTPALLELTYVYSWPGGSVRFLHRDPTTEQCIALAGGLHKCHCRIYSDRPHLCAEFEVGSDLCHEARQKMGIDPTPPPDEPPAA